MNRSEAKAPHRMSMEQRGKLKHHLIKLQGKRCVVCGQILVKRKAKDSDPLNFATLDHKVPLSLGGDDTPENISVICRRCNLQKGSRLITYRDLREEMCIPKVWIGRK